MIELNQSLTNRVNTLLADHPVKQATMRQALESNWTSELSEQLKLLALPPVARNAGENILRPAFAKERPAGQARARPDLAPALDVVVRAADLIRSAQERAEVAELQARRFAEQGASKLKIAEEEIAKLRERAETAEERLETVTARAAERLADADQEMRATREQLRREEERANHAERLVSEQMAKSQALLKDANDRVFAAETRALEAKEDLSYVENYIREQFAV